MIWLDLAATLAAAWLGVTFHGVWWENINRAFRYGVANGGKTGMAEKVLATVVACALVLLITGAIWS